MTIGATARDYPGPMSEEQALDGINRATGRLLRLNASRAAFARSAAAAGISLTYPAYLLLRAVIDHGPISMGQLADLVNMDAGMAARQVAKLVDAELVHRLSDARDGRVSLIAATKAGTKAGNALTEVRMRHLRRSISEWSDRDLRTFARLLNRFVDDMASTHYEVLGEGETEEAG